MQIGLIDVDGHNFPSLPLMKLSAWHKMRGDEVQWYSPVSAGLARGGRLDRVYMSKVFSFTKGYEYPIYADEILRGGSGNAISIKDGKEVYDASKDRCLPYEVEHIYPDYGLYQSLTRGTAYGFLTRGCPRGCGFCHVGAKEGGRSQKVADVSEFWQGQKNIVLCDPNLLACKEWKELLLQLADTKAYVNFNQGLDIRLMTEEKAELLGKIKFKTVHFAWDRYGDGNSIIPRLKMFKEITGLDIRKTSVYVLCNYGSTIEEDLERIYTLRDMGYWPYVMLYDKEHIPKGHVLRRMQRWCNNRFIFSKCERFEDYETMKMKGA